MSFFNPEAHAAGLDVVKLNDEVRRIEMLPRRSLADIAEHLVDELTDILRTDNGEMRLRPMQAVALYEIGTVGGLFGIMRVGSGKTIVSALAPEVGFAERPLLLVPAGLKGKTERDFAELGRHWAMPSFCKIMSYEWLGRVQAAEALEEYAPDMIIADEAHRLKNPQAACTRRVRRYVTNHPDTKMIVMSGTITKRSLKDYAHLLRWCLPPADAPIPRWHNDLELWADALDERKNQIRRADPGALIVFCNDAERALWETEPRRAARQGYRRRLTDTPGVVATNETAVDASLVLKGVEPPIAAGIDKSFKTLREDYKTPDGWPIADGLAMFRHARELALGFYYVWYNHDGWTECLAQILKNDAYKLSPTERRILSACVHTTASGIDLAKALEILKSSSLKKELGISKQDTGSPSNSTKSFGENSTDVATSANVEKSRATDGVKGTSQLTTIIERELFAASCASSAIERSACWVTILKASPQLLSIFEQARIESRPPQYWLNARTEWCAYVRRILSHSRTLDTELQVRNTVAREVKKYADGQDILEEWIACREDFKPNTEPVWIDECVAEHCARWAEKNVGIVWTEHTCFGERVAELAGVPYFGKKGKTADGSAYIEDATGSLVASIQSNGTGRNLQRWSRALIAGMPANGLQTEQLLGRLHREGQEADEVRFDVLTTCAEHVGAFWQAVADSEYALDSMGSPQKILVADVDVATASSIAFRSGPRWYKGK